MHLLLEIIQNFLPLPIMWFSTSSISHYRNDRSSSGSSFQKLSKDELIRRLQLRREKLEQELKEVKKELAELSAE